MLKEFFKKWVYEEGFGIFIFSLLFMAIVWATFNRRLGSILIDDAFITFRYAENIAKGEGWVYNPGERVQGTTCPIFCLLLALFKKLGISPLVSSVLMNYVSVAFTSFFLYRIGRDKGLKRVGFFASLLFIFFPHIWWNMLTGMESIFCAMLCILLVWLWIKEKEFIVGIVGGILVLVRPDALSIVCALGLMSLIKEPKKVLRMVIGFIVVVFPWLLFSQFYFGSIIPQSILAKKLIHPFPSSLVIKKYLNWFFSSYGLAILSGLALLGIIKTFISERWAVSLLLWFIFFILGMALSEVGPFFWYKIPLLGGFFLLCALGVDFIALWIERMGFRRLSFIAMAVIVLICVVVNFRGISNITASSLGADKERVNFRIAKEIKEISKPGKKIFVGEVGVLGYYLQDFYILDSAGIVSKEVYNIRLDDREELLKRSREYRYDWWGTEKWVLTVIDKFKPEYIISDINYLHLKELILNNDFNHQYQLIRKFPVKNLNSWILVLERKNE